MMWLLGMAWAQEAPLALQIQIVDEQGQAIFAELVWSTASQKSDTQGYVQLPSLLADEWIDG